MIDYDCREEQVTEKIAYQLMVKEKQKMYVCMYSTLARQILFLHRGIIACSISALHKKSLILFIGLIKTYTTIMVGSVK